MKNELSKIYITESLLERSRALLASFITEAERTEGVVYWFGLELPGKSIVTSLMVPNAETNWGCISTSPKANAEVLMSIVGTPLVLIGQAHSHPGAMVRHSDIDDRQTFPRFEGAISLVVPHFALRGIDLERCGVHRFMDGAYQLLPTEDVLDHFVVIPGERDFRIQHEQEQCEE